MAKYTGVTPYGSGWQYRIKKRTEDGKLVDTRIKSDIDGKPFLRAIDAFKAREAHLRELDKKATESPQQPVVTTLEDIYINYQNTEAKEKQASTLRKQDSMWRNHIYQKFGQRDINSITVIELRSFLVEIYSEYSYKYTEGFLKFFYLLFGHARRMDIIDRDKYNEYFVLRDTRLSMPKQRTEDLDDDKVTVYSDIDLHLMEQQFKNGDANLLIAFYLGLYCGLRLSECFGLRWRDIDFSARTIKISRQLIYNDNELRLTGVKTLKSVRTVLIPSKLYEELMIYYDMQVANQNKYGESYKNTEKVYDEIERQWIAGSDFVNRKVNGELLTTNSMKYWAKKFKRELNIDFKYHSLRHTFATRCALSNMNIYSLMDYMGHMKIETTKKYYINTDDEHVREYNLGIIDYIQYRVDHPYGKLHIQTKGED